MRRINSTLCVANHRRKPLACPRQSPLGCVVAQDRHDILLQRSSLVAPEVSCRRRPRVLWPFTHGQAQSLRNSSRDVVGGGCPSDLRDRSGAACPPGPPLHRSSVEPPVPMSVTGPCLVDAPSAILHHVILFVCHAEPAGALGSGAAATPAPSRSGARYVAAGRKSSRTTMPPRGHGHENLLWAAVASGAIRRSLAR